MTAFDEFRTQRHKLEWARLDKTLPGGIHRPQKPGDIGWDLEAMEDVLIRPMESVDIPVNARIHLPPDMYADLRNRSSMARRGLYVDHGLIDNGYRGPLYVFVRNMALPPHSYEASSEYNDRTVLVRAGERIAQLVFHKAVPVWDLEVDEIDIDTVRGETGFGSTNGGGAS